MADVNKYSGKTESKSSSQPLKKTIKDAAVRILFNNPLIKTPVAAAFQIIYYHARSTWVHNTFLGYPILQNPFDLQVYQELLYQIRPAFILQTGIAAGGSLLFFASILDMLKMENDALVIGIDCTLTDKAQTLDHPRIKIIEGDSTDPGVIAKVRELIRHKGGFITLDSAHNKEHVAKEIESYKDMVAIGSYLVVEDTHINGHPVSPLYGPGPYEAVKDFLRADTRFTKDKTIWKKNLFSFHGHGWLKRIR